MNHRKHFFAIGMTALMLGIFGIGSVKAAGPKSAQANWESLKHLAAGDEVRVVLNDGKSYAAKFQGFSDEAIVVRTFAGEQTFSRQDVLRVSAKGESHRMRNALIGAGISAGVGAIALGACDYREVIPCGGKGAALGAAFFAPLGVAAGAVIPTGRWHDVYRAR